MALQVGQPVKLLREIGTPKRGHGVIKAGTNGTVSQIRRLKSKGGDVDEVTVVFDGKRTHYFVGSAERFIEPTVAKV